MLSTTQERDWQLRASSETVQAVRVCMAATHCHVNQHATFIALDETLFVQRRWKSAPLFLHALITLRTAQTAHPYFVLWDRAEGEVWQWQTHLRYLHLWAERIGRTMPPLLMLCPNQFRLRAMLTLAHLTRTLNSTLIVTATPHQPLALREGLLAVMRQPDGWRTMIDNERIAAIDPFALPGTPLAEFEPRRFASARRKAHAPAPELPQYLERFEALNEAEIALLKFLCRNPVVPQSVIGTLIGNTDGSIDEALARLTELGLAEHAAEQVRNLHEPMWAASDIALQLYTAREMLPASTPRRYHFYRADHERRAHHTLAAYQFLANLKQHCERRSKATRKLHGDVPYYALDSFESEFIASDWYSRFGTSHYFRPDGAGVVRAGATLTHFWVEMDGTPAAPSRKDPAVWAGKLSRLCEYVQTGRWALRYPELPRLLIITTDLRNLPYIADALGFAARARMMEPPLVFVAALAAVQQRGPLAKIWREVLSEDDDAGLVYAFDDVAPLAVASTRLRPLNLIDELQRAEAMGLLNNGRR
jgi:hypothetical protein